MLLPDLKGFSDIQRLLERPGEEIHCLDLAERLPSEHGGDEVLDDRARAALKARIRDLQEEIAEAEDRNDIGRTERLRAEFDTLVETLSQALGLGGRSRRLGSLAERARTTVTWRIRHAVQADRGRASRARPALRAQPAHRHLLQLQPRARGGVAARPGAGRLGRAPRLTAAPSPVRASSGPAPRPHVVRPDLTPSPADAAKAVRRRARRGP